MPKHHMRLLAVLFLLLLIGAYFALALLFNLWPFPRHAMAPTSESPTQQPSTVISPSSSADPTADWKTYQNNTFNFEFKYPNGTIEDKGCRVYLGKSICSIILNQPSSRLVILVNNSGLGGIQLSRQSEKGTITIGGITTSYVYGHELENGLEDKPLESYALLASFSKNEDTYDILYEYHEAHPGVFFDQVMRPLLSTFRFVGPGTSASSQLDTSGWETYTNTYNNFEIKIPPILKNYKVTLQEMSSNFGAGTYIFSVPTNDTKYGSSYIEIGKGYASPFAISVYNHDYWNSLQKKDGPRPTYLAENRDYVFAVSTWQDPPLDWRNKTIPFNTIFKSFRLIK